MIEAYCDECCDALAAHFQKQGLYLRPRFSPGYGDLSLDCQPAFLRVLDAEKRIGLTCTASHLMAPSKSVTAIIGLFHGTGTAVAGLPQQMRRLPKHRLRLPAGMNGTAREK